MLFSLEIWLAGLILFSPVVVLALTWARSGEFQRSHAVPKKQRVLYRVGLVSASFITVAYLGYWGWRICSLYQTAVPFWALYGLDRGIYLSRALSVVAIFGLLTGRGPYRTVALVTTLWVALLVWMNRGIIHWA